MLKQNLTMFGLPPWLRGFVCTYHPAALGLNPKHTIYTFSACIEIDIGMRKGQKLHEKEAGIGPFFKLNILKFRSFGHFFLYLEPFQTTICSSQKWDSTSRDSSPIFFLLQGWHVLPWDQYSSLSLISIEMFFSITINFKITENL